MRFLRFQESIGSKLSLIFYACKQKIFKYIDLKTSVLKKSFKENEKKIWINRIL
jgi:hypothetical protein